MASTETTPPHRRIVLRLAGGLGNQMFQYAFGLHLSRSTTLPLCLDCSAYERDRKRRYDLDSFHVSAPVGNEVVAFLNPPADRLRPVWSRAVNRWSRDWIWLREGQDDVERLLPAVRGSSKSLYVEGYWQQRCWFDLHEDLLRREYKLCVDLERELEGLQKLLGDGPRVGVHVRRGDYVTDQRTAARHNVCSVDYYRRAVRAVAERAGDNAVVIFSDEPEWAARNLELSKRQVVVPAGASRRPALDLVLLSRCDHFVLSNSSFSWWAASLSASRNAVVVVPDRWYADATDSDRLTHQQWIPVPATAS